MNQRATIITPTLPSPKEPSTTPTTVDSQAKPKVMRRPAQFSKPALRNELAAAMDTRIAQVAAQTAAPAVEQSPTLRPWQDDARFAIALLAIVIAVNIALSILLAPMDTKPASAIAAKAAQPAPIQTPAAEPMAKPTALAPESLIEHLNEAGASVSEQ